VGGDVPGHDTSNKHEDDERSDHVGFLNFHDKVRSVGETANWMPISQRLKGLWPVAPTTPPMKAAAAMASMKRANPSFCSLLNLDGIAAF
jgi:hypothetical protein